MNTPAHILALDDDPTSVTIIERILTAEGYSVSKFTDAASALEAFREQRFDLIVSDYFMPEMNGDQFLKKIRAEDSRVAFVFLTANTDIEVAIELVKTGADDHITKPIVEEELKFRVAKNLREKEQERAVERAEQERAFLELEKEKLVNWRDLYASKDIHQTEQMINLLSRTINQSGGFLWIDLLKSTLEKIDEEHYRIGKDLVEMILTSAESQKQIFDYINFINTLDTLELNIEKQSVPAFCPAMETFMDRRLGELCEKHGREKVVLRSEKYPTGTVSVDTGYVERILHELFCNAVKFSPPDSRILASIDRGTEHGKDVLRFLVRNRPVESKERGPDGEPVLGVPYDYSELVFDLFYTIDSFPRELEEEEWGDGTGLYVARKLVSRMNGWISSGNGVDYTGDIPQTFVRFTVTIPVQ